jgi:hypothetical protein
MPFLGWMPKEFWGGLSSIEPGLNALSQGIASRFSPMGRATRGWLDNPYNFFNAMTGQFSGGAPGRIRRGFVPYYDPNNPFNWILVPPGGNVPSGFVPYEGGGLPWTAEQQYEYKQREPEKKQAGGVVKEPIEGGLGELRNLMQLERNLTGKDRKLVAAEPGEFVLSKPAVELIGGRNLELLNEAAKSIPKMQGGGWPKTQTREYMEEQHRTKEASQPPKGLETAKGLKAERDELSRIYGKLVDSGMPASTPIEQWGGWRGMLSPDEWELVRRYAQRQIASQLSGRAGTPTEVGGGFEQITPPEEYPPLVFGALTSQQLMEGMAGGEIAPPQGQAPGAGKAPAPTPTAKLPIGITGPYAGPNIPWEQLGEMSPDQAMAALQMFASSQMPWYDPFAGLTRPYEKTPQSTELFGKLQQQYGEQQQAVKRSLDINTFMAQHRADIDLKDAQTRRLLQDAALLEGKLKALGQGGAVLSPEDRDKAVKWTKDITEHMYNVVKDSNKIEVWREYWRRYLTWQFLLDPTAYMRPIEDILAGAMRMKGTSKVAITEQDVNDAWMAARAIEGSGITPAGGGTFMDLWGQGEQQ